MTVTQQLKRVLFLQLPRLENEILGEGENLPTAGFYLHHALQGEGRASAHEAVFLSPHDQALDDAHLVKRVVDRLPDLFEEQVKVRLEDSGEKEVPPGVSSRRALIIQGRGLYLHRERIHAMVRRAIEEEPHMLWQFVLNPEEEEPLNLMEEMIDVIHAYPSQWLDRFSSVAAWERVASRRIFVLLKRGRTYSRAWIKAAEELLEDAFY